jgi:hypothetical protein
MLVAKGSICVFPTDLHGILDKVGIGPDPGTHLHFVALIPQNEANSRICYNFKITLQPPPSRIPNTFNIRIHIFNFSAKRPFVLNSEYREI